MRKSSQRYRVLTDTGGGTGRRPPSAVAPLLTQQGALRTRQLLYAFDDAPKRVRIRKRPTAAAGAAYRWQGVARDAPVAPIVLVEESSDQEQQQQQPQQRQQEQQQQLDLQSKQQVEPGSEHASSSKGLTREGSVYLIDKRDVCDETKDRHRAEEQDARVESHSNRSQSDINSDADDLVAADGRGQDHFGKERSKKLASAGSISATPALDTARSDEAHQHYQQQQQHSLVKGSSAYETSSTQQQLSMARSGVGGTGDLARDTKGLSFRDRPASRGPQRAGGDDRDIAGDEEVNDDNVRDNDGGRLATAGRKPADPDEDRSMLSLEEHLLLMESRLVEDIAEIIRDELAEFRSLFLSSPAESPEPEDQLTGEDIEEVFKSVARLGDSKGGGHLLSLSNLDRWWRQAGVIDGRRISTTDTAIHFRKIAKAKRNLTFHEYLLFMESLAASKKISLDEIRYKLCCCGPPVASGRSRATAQQPGTAGGGGGGGGNVGYRRYEDK